jgi:hypothetical protein
MYLHVSEVLSLQKNWVRKSQIRKSQFRNCGSFANIKIFKSANLRICDLRNLFADHPSLVKMNLKLTNLQGKNLIIKIYFFLFPAPAGCLQYFTSAGWSRLNYLKLLFYFHIFTNSHSQA